MYDVFPVNKKEVLEFEVGLNLMIGPSSSALDIKGLLLIRPP